MSKKKIQSCPSDLSTQIKRAIGYRILVCFILAMVAISIIAANDIISSKRQLEKNLEEQCGNLESFVISQVIVKNEDSIKPKLDDLNKKLGTIKFTWDNKKKIASQKKLQWRIPFSWVYLYPVKYIDGTKLGMFIVTGSVFYDHGLFSDLLTKSALLLLFFTIIFIVLYPLGKRIPQQLFITPINNLLLLLRNGKSEIETENLLVAPSEIAEIRDKITTLLKDSEERSREAAFGQMATQVAHDIRSPLTALDLVVKDIINIPEDRRILIRNATNRIHDIANNLLTHYKKKDAFTSNEANLKNTSELIADLVLSVVSEKSVQYKNKLIKFETNIHELACSCFSTVSGSEFKRVLSNLINNAVEAMEGKKNEIIRITLIPEENHITISIQDKGCGIPTDLLKKLITGKICSQKESGHGLGLSHAIKMVEEEWGGQFQIQSFVNIGTTVEIILPKVSTPKWFLSKLIVDPKESIVILDDDESIHQVWRSRFKNIDASVSLIEFYSTDELLIWHREHLSEAGIFLMDYELIGSSETGLDLIKQLNISSHAYLVTSRYEELDIRERCEKLGLRLIPKNFAVHIPISMMSIADSNPDLIFIDDDKDLTYAWTLRAEMLGKSVLTFNSVEDFRSVKTRYYKKDVPIYIDSDLGNGLKGQDFAKELHREGFSDIYLATGYQPSYFGEMSWIKAVVGKEPPF